MIEREFRAWDRENKKWIDRKDKEYDDRVTASIICNGYFELETWYSNGLHCEMIDICQYTGHEDKNGKGICDKSIIKSDYNKDCIYLIKQISPVEWRVYVKYKETELKLYDENILDFLFTTEHLEVIGNMYENSELLVGAPNQNGY